MKNTATVSGMSFLSFLFAPLAKSSLSPREKEYAINDSQKVIVRNGFAIKSIRALAGHAGGLRKKCACTEMLYNLNENTFYVADRDDVESVSHDKTCLIKMDQYVDKVKDICDEQNFTGAFGYLLMSSFGAMAELGNNPELEYGLYLGSAGSRNPWQKLKECDFDLHLLTAKSAVAHF